MIDRRAKMLLLATSHSVLWANVATQSVTASLGSMPPVPNLTSQTSRMMSTRIYNGAPVLIARFADRGKP